MTTTPRRTADDLREKRIRDRYQRWLAGKNDRLDGKPCASANGTYLDGWYSQDTAHPEFLTYAEFIELRDTPK